MYAYLDRSYCLRIARPEDQVDPRLPLHSARSRLASSVQCDKKTLLCWEHTVPFTTYATCVPADRGDNDITVLRRDLSRQTFAGSELANAPLG
jgi:hypothetical protein